MMGPQVLSEQAFSLVAKRLLWFLAVELAKPTTKAG
jgi:hypothetical protein